jgi:hypothetical protein
LIFYSLSILLFIICAWIIVLKCGLRSQLRHCRCIDDAVASTTATYNNCGLIFNNVYDLVVTVSDDFSHVRYLRTNFLNLWNQFAMTDWPQLQQPLLHPRPQEKNCYQTSLFSHMNLKAISSTFDIVKFRLSLNYFVFVYRDKNYLFFIYLFIFIFKMGYKIRFYGETAHNNFSFKAIFRFFSNS